MPESPDTVPGRRAPAPAVPPEGLVRIERRDGVTVISMAGEIDLDSAPGVERAVLGAVEASAGRRVVIELSRVRLFGACGVTVLVTAHERARCRGGDVVVVLDDVAPAARTLGCIPEIVLPVFRTVTAALDAAPAQVADRHGP